MWNQWNAIGNAALQMNAPAPPASSDALAGQALNATTNYSASAGGIAASSSFMCMNPTSIVPLPAANPYAQYTAAQFASMTPEQQYALQQHWQQWEIYQQEYAKWYAQYGEQYKREVEAANVANSSYGNYFQQQSSSSLLQASSSPLQQSNKLTVPSALFSQPPPAVVTTSATGCHAISNPPLHMPPPNQTTTFANPPPLYNALQPPPSLSQAKETFTPSKRNCLLESREQNPINDFGQQTTETNQIRKEYRDGKPKSDWQNAIPFNTLTTASTMNWYNQGNNSRNYINPDNSHRTGSQKTMELDEESFDRQFHQWEKQFEKWKRTNAAKADTQVYKRYEQEFEKQRQRIIERRDAMRQRKIQQLNQTSHFFQSKEQRPSSINAINRQAKDISIDSELIPSSTKEDPQTSYGKHENNVLPPANDNVINLDDDGDGCNNDQLGGKDVQPISDLFKKSNGIPGLDLLKNAAFNLSNDAEENNPAVNTSKDALNCSNETSQSNASKPSANAFLPAIAKSLNDPEFMRRITEAVAKAQGKDCPKTHSTRGNQFPFVEWQKLRNAGQSNATLLTEHQHNTNKSYANLANVDLNTRLNNSNVYQLNESENSKDLPPVYYHLNQFNDFSANNAASFADKTQSDFDFPCVDKDFVNCLPGSRRDGYRINNNTPRTIPNGRQSRSFNAYNHRFHYMNAGADNISAPATDFHYKTNSWLRGSYSDFDGYYRPVKVFDYGNGSLAATKVIDYGHKSIDEFQPVKTIDYDHTSTPKFIQQNQRARKINKITHKRNNNKNIYKKANNNNKNLNRNNYKRYENKRDRENVCKKSAEELKDFKDLATLAQINNDAKPKTGQQIILDIAEDLEEISDTDDLCEISDVEKEDNENVSPAPPPPPPPDLCSNTKALPGIIPSASRANNEDETKASFEHPSIKSINEILLLPGRLTRPKKICLLVRGPPGSGKSYVSKQIKEMENRMGGVNVRILSIDDYFLIENDYEEKCATTGKKIAKKEILYEYDKDMEETYMQYLMKSFKKTVGDSLYNFIIIDCNNNSLRTLNEFYLYSKESGFTPFIIDLLCDLEICCTRNIHQRSKADIQDIISAWNPTPLEYNKLDVTTLLDNVKQMKDAKQKDQPAVDVEVEDKNDDDDDSNDAIAYCGFLKSKWEMDNTSETLERLDGTSRLSNKRKPTMEEYLQMDDWRPSVSVTGEKRVRWADIEEKRQQDKMRAVGFVVGQTDWKRMMDPNAANKALNRTKYIERINKRY